MERYLVLVNPAADARTIAIPLDVEVTLVSVTDGIHGNTVVVDVAKEQVSAYEKYLDTHAMVEEYDVTTTPSEPNNNHETKEATMSSSEHAEKETKAKSNGVKASKPKHARAAKPAKAPKPTKSPKASDLALDGEGLPPRIAYNHQLGLRCNDEERAELVKYCRENKISSLSNGIRHRMGWGSLR